MGLADVLEVLPYIRPYAKHSFIFAPIRGYEGETEGGLILPGHESDLYPPVFGVVQIVHPTCDRVRVGDLVMFEPYGYTIDSDIWYADESAVIAIIDEGATPV